MRKSFSLVIGLLLATFLGVNYIEPQPKSYVPNTYYVGNQNLENVDFKALFNAHTGSSFATIASCNLDQPRTLSGYSTLLGYNSDNKKRLYWFWLVKVNSAESDTDAYYNQLASPQSDSNKSGYKWNAAINAFMWEVPVDTRLVSTARSTLVASTQHAEAPYPESTPTKGVHVSYVVEMEEVAYRITYRGLSRWWCCMGKEKPDNENTEEPRYGHTVIFSDKDVFEAGETVGLSGLTGTPKDERVKLKEAKTTKLYVTVERCTIKDGTLQQDWTFVRDLDELYEIVE